MESVLQGQIFKDNLIYVPLCVEDDTILVQKGDDNGHSLIFTALLQNEGWNDAGRRLARQVQRKINMIPGICICYVDLNFTGYGKYFLIFRCFPSKITKHQVMSTG